MPPLPAPHGAPPPPPTTIDWNSPSVAEIEKAITFAHGRKFKDRGPPAPEEGGPELWRGQKWRSSSQRWGNRGGKRKEAWKQFFADKKQRSGNDHSNDEENNASKDVGDVRESEAKQTDAGDVKKKETEVVGDVQAHADFKKKEIEVVDEKEEAAIVNQKTLDQKTESNAQKSIFVVDNPGKPS